MKPRDLPWSPILALLALSCGGSVTTEPVYGGCATDENWRTFDDYETSQPSRVKDDPVKDPVWKMPAAGASLPAGTPAIFQWQPSQTQTGSADGNAQCAGSPAALGGGASASLVPQHLAPVSGTAYDLHFTSGGKEVYRVLTTRQQATVPQATWAGWAGQTLSVDLIKADLLKNDVVDGPYHATLSFQVSR